MATTSALLKTTEFDISLRDAGSDALETDVSSAPVEDQLLSRALPEKTEPRKKARAYDFSIEIAAPAQPQPAAHAVAPAPAPSEVHGTVLEPLGASVLCELNLQAGPHRIRLPGALFPTETVYGSPFTLRMVEDRGIRKPVIELRSRRMDADMEASEARIAALIAALESE